MTNDRNAAVQHATDVEQGTAKAADIVKPTQNGCYWLRWCGKVRLVEVTNYSENGAFVDFIGQEDYCMLSEIEGEWHGPLVSPWGKGDK